MEPKPLILITYDPTLSVEAVEATLQKSGWQTLAVRGFELQEILHEAKPEVIVVAVSSGVPVSRVVEQAFLHRASLPLPILVLSTSPDYVEAYASALEAGGDNFLPLNAPERQLTAVVSSLLRRGKYRRNVIEQAESRFVRIFENAAVGIAQVKPDGAWLQVNERLCQLLGYSRGELAKKTFQELTYPPDLPGDLELLGRLLRGDIESYRLEKRYIHKDGHIVWGNLSVGIDRANDGTPKYLVAVVEEISDRKIAERERAEAQERLTAALSASATGTFRWDIKDNHLYWDESLKKIFGYPPGYPIRRIDDFTNCLHPDDRGPVFSALERCRQLGTDFDLEFRIIWPDGSVHWLSDRGRMFLDADGNPEYMTGACLDITGRKQEGEDRRANQERLHLALRSANAGSFDWDIVNDVAQWSPEMEALYGLQTGEFPGKVAAFRPLVHPEDRDFAEQVIADGLKTGEVNAQWRIVRPSGEIRWVSAAGKVYYDFNGKPLRMLGVNIDITSQKEAEQALREKAQIIDQIHDAIVTADHRSNITLWNRGAERLFGYTSDEVLGRPVTLLHLNTDQGKLLAQVWASIRETGVFEQDSPLRRKSGDIFDAHLSIVAVRNERGEITGTIGYVQDITERKRTEQALRVSEKLAATGRLASTLAHEINNPLASVTNLLYLLEQHSALDGVGKSYVTLAGAELARVTHITRNLLSFHRENREPQLVDAAVLLDNVIELYGPKLRSREVTLRRKYRDRSYVRVFPGEFKQVVSNLIDNAIDAVGADGRLDLRVKRIANGGPAGGVQISISDNGKGIEREHLRQLFEPFFTTKGEKGTGLGLWVTKDLVTKQGGRIRVRSRKGSGSVFSIVLPAGAVAAQAQGSAD